MMKNTPTPRLQIRPGVLDRIRELRGIQTDRAMAGAIGVSVEEYRRVHDGGIPSTAFIAGLSDAFGYGIGETCQVITSNPVSNLPAAA